MSSTVELNTRLNTLLQQFQGLQGLLKGHGNASGTNEKGN
jgi:hypothetical protein